MVHQPFDLDAVLPAFPLAALRAEARRFVLARQKQFPKEYRKAGSVERHIRLMEPEPVPASSPYAIAVIEQLRREALAGRKAAQLPADVFIFARGEPDDRRVTKIGGLPYWPRRREWPKAADGSRKRFVAQVCFLDSRRALGEPAPALPGDILVVFAAATADEYPQEVSCHWVSAGAQELVGPGDVPRGGWDFLPCYGQLHRTHDYAGPVEAFATHRAGSLLEAIQGTKIGGRPNWVQGEVDLPGRFLCSIGSVNPPSERPYPYANVPEPLAPGEEYRTDHLGWGDEGCLYVSVERDGTLHWAGQSG